MRSLIVFLALSASAASAHTKPTPPPTTPAPITVNTGAVAGAHADADASAAATAHSASDATSNATGGKADASANSGGNALTVTNQQVRQAPPVSLGGLFIGECGSGAQGGGSNSRGAAALGFAWTPKDCKRLLAARALAALGMFKEACLQVMRVSVVAETYADTPLNERPSCEFEQHLVGGLAQPGETATPAVDLSTYATKEELSRAFRAATGK